MSNHLDLFLPEWQGFGESLSVFHGAFALHDQLSPHVSFSTIDVPTANRLEVENQILGYRSNLKILESVRALLELKNPSTVFLIGGTCASEIAPVSFLNQKYDRDIAVLWFDAHGDLNTPESSPSKHFHGMPLRTLLGDGPPEIQACVFENLSCSQVVLAGSRDLDELEVVYVENNPIVRLSAAELVNTDDLRSTISDLGSTNLYIHLDLDVLEPDDFPHLLIPTPGGILFDELVRVLSHLRDSYSVVGSSIVEYVPVAGGDPDRMALLVDILRPGGLPR